RGRASDAPIRRGGRPSRRARDEGIRRGVYGEMSQRSSRSSGSSHRFGSTPGDPDQRTDQTARGIGHPVGELGASALDVSLVPFVEGVDGDNEEKRREDHAE